jgi:hypothetical protein
MERSQLLHALAAELERRADELARVETAQTGKRIKLSSGFDVPGTIDNASFFAGAGRVMEGTAAGEYSADHTSMIRREPVGVVGSVAPWNYPLKDCTAATRAYVHIDRLADFVTGVADLFAGIRLGPPWTRRPTWAPSPAPLTGQGEPDGRGRPGRGSVGTPRGESAGRRAGRGLLGSHRPWSPTSTSAPRSSRTRSSGRCSQCWDSGDSETVQQPGHNHVACRPPVTDKTCGCWHGDLELFHPMPGGVSVRP